MTDIVTDVVAPDPTQRLEPDVRRRRKPTNVVLAVVAIVLLALALSALFYGFGARSNASDARNRARALRQEESALAHRQTKAERRRDAARDAVDTVRTRLEELGAALGTTTDAERAYTDLVNHASELYNGGDDAGSIAIFQNEARAAFDELAGRVTAADASVEAVRVAMQHLEEELR